MSASSAARGNRAVFQQRRLSRGVRPELRMRLRSSALDRLLLAGEPPGASRELNWRAAELPSRKSRRALADQIDRLVDDAMGPARHRGAPAPRAALLLD